MMYKPLPDSLTIKPSKVNGLGLFAKEVIPQATNLGMTHLEIGKTILRTPLGGFINHANDPNCIKVKLLMTNHDDPNCEKAKLKFTNSDKQTDYLFNKWNLITIKDIKKDEEITLKYTFYKV